MITRNEYLGNCVEALSEGRVDVETYNAMYDQADAFSEAPEDNEEEIEKQIKEAVADYKQCVKAYAYFKQYLKSLEGETGKYFDKEWERTVEALNRFSQQGKVLNENLTLWVGVEKLKQIKAEALAEYQKEEC